MHDTLQKAAPVTAAADGAWKAYPISYSQERLWILDQIDPGTAAYNIATAFRITGPLDRTVLDASLRYLAERHPALRTTFELHDGQPVQVVHSRLEPDIQHQSLSEIQTHSPTADVESVLLSAAKHSFDLSRGPLYRPTLLELSSEEHYLLFCLHHIVTDGWSNAQLYQELSTIYAANMAGEAPDLPEPMAEYTDFTAWQRSPKQEERQASELAYWREQLSGAPQPDFPTDFPRPPVQSHAAALVSLEIDAHRQAQIRALGTAQRATPYMIYLAAFKLVLQRWTGQDDLVVGAPLAGRQMLETETMVGFFLNSLAIRTQLEPEMTFEGLLERLRWNTIMAFDNQAIPFERVVNDLRPERDLSRTPLFQIYFNMLSLPEDSLQFGQAVGKAYRLPPYRSIFDLTVYLTPREHELAVRFVYNPDLFAPATIQALADQFRFVLDQVLVDPTRQLSDYELRLPSHLELLPDPEQVLDDGWAGSLPARLSQTAAQQPQAAALVLNNETFTYADLDRGVDQIAAHLQSHDVGPGDVVPIFAGREPDLVFAVFGILRAGAAFLMLDPAYPVERLVAMLDQVDARLLLTVGTLNPPETLSRGRQVLSARALRAGDGRPEPVDLGPMDLAVVGFTSGSTGQPKGILGLHGSLTHFNPWMVEHYGLSSAERFSSLSGLAHDPLQRELFTAMWSGGSLHFPDADVMDHPALLGPWMQSAGITFAHLTPAMGQLLTDMTDSALSLPELAHIYYVGDRLTRRHVAAIQALAPNVRIWNGYGSTETQRAVAMHEVRTTKSEGPAAAVLPLGRGIPGVQLLVRGRHGASAGVGELGEIYVRSPHLAAGYLHDPDLTEQRFGVDEHGARLYRTGDLGRYTPEGSVIFAGRADRQVKIRGFRIELAEIEAALTDIEGLETAIAALVEMASGGPRLEAYFTTNDQDVELGSIRDQLRARLPDYMIPARLVPVETVPLTPNGKTDFEALRALAGPSLSTPAVLAQTETEQQLAEIWAELLEREQVFRDDHFFDLGGHSLLAIRLFARITAELGVELPLSILFQAPTLAELASQVDQGEGAAQSYVVPIQPDGSLQPFFCVHGFGGGVIGYAELARQLGSDRPFYGLQAAGLADKREPDNNVTTMAQRYIEAMKSIQSEGPYLLGGYCFGGVVAFEMARQLEAQGEQVDLLAVLEGYAPLRGSQRETVWNNPRLLVNFLQNLPYWFKDFISLGLPGMSARFSQVARRYRAQLRRRMGYVEDVDLRQIIDDDVEFVPDVHRRLMQIHVRAMGSYVPADYSGAIDLFRVQGRSLLRTPDPFNGWGKLSGQGVTLHRIEGRHQNILEPPHVTSLAQALRQALDEHAP